MPAPSTLLCQPFDLNVNHISKLQIKNSVGLWLTTQLVSGDGNFDPREVKLDLSLETLKQKFVEWSHEATQNPPIESILKAWKMIPCFRELGTVPLVALGKAICDPSTLPTDFEIDHLQCEVESESEFEPASESIDEEQ